MLSTIMPKNTTNFFHKVKKGKILSFSSSLSLFLILIRKIKKTITIQVTLKMYHTNAENELFSKKYTYA